MKRKQLFVKSIVFCLLVLVQSNYLLSMNEKTITIEKIPQTIEEFIALRDTLAVTPEGGATVMLVAMMVYIKDQDLGLKCLTIALARRNLMNGSVYKGFKPKGSIMMHIRRLTSPRMVYVPYAYIEGASKEDGYQVNLPYKFNYFHNRHTTANKGLMRIMINCYGAAFPRPVTMQQNDKGIWKAYECSSLFMDVVPPTKKVEDDL